MSALPACVTVYHLARVGCLLRLESEPLELQTVVSYYVGAEV